jgi:hypothetical protein
MRILLSIALPFTLFTTPAFSQGRGVPKSCAPDSSVHVTMVGFVFLRTYPGPPNYESVSRGDTPETGLYLGPDGWACRPAPGDTLPYYTTEDIQWIQLLLSEDDYPRMRKYLHKHVELRGTLSPGATGHHHTFLVFQADRPLKVRVLDP